MCRCVGEYGTACLKVLYMVPEAREKTEKERHRAGSTFLRVYYLHHKNIIIVLYYCCYYYLYL
jgi:hypothetical protein